MFFITYASPFMYECSGEAFYKNSLICESFAFPIKMKEPFKCLMSMPHLRNHLRQHLHPYHTSLPFHPYDDVSVSWFVDLCRQVLTYPMKDPRKKVSQEVIINYHYYFWQLTNNIFPPKLTGLTFTCQNWRTGTGERKNVHKPPPEDATVTTIT